MNRFSIVAALCAACCAAPVSANPLSFSGGATLTSNFISRGYSQTGDGWALQPWVEVETSNGWYGGLWASNISAGADTAELDVYGGFHWDVGQTSFDISYTQVFLNSSGDAGGEIGFGIEQALERVTLFGGVVFAATSGLPVADVNAGASFAMTDQVSASLTIGSAGGEGYGDIGVTYAMSDLWELDARYHHGNGIAQPFVVAASVSF